MKTTEWADVPTLLLARRRIDPIRGCWIWPRAVDGKGYGVLTIQQKQYRIHRLSAHLWNGVPLDSPSWTLHKCDVPRCFNPEHLYQGDLVANQRDMVSRQRSTLGEKNRTAILTASDVLCIRELHAGGMSQPDIAKLFGVKTPAIWKIVSRRNWRHI